MCSLSPLICAPAPSPGVFPLHLSVLNMELVAKGNKDKLEAAQKSKLERKLEKVKSRGWDVEILVSPGYCDEKRM